MPPLPRSFYLRTDVVLIARDLLGKVLCSRIDGVITSGILCETEAYAGVTDRASHAFGGRRSVRTGVMYARGGTAYIYLCYGIHSLFNVVTNREGIPEAVLVRGILPLDNRELMLLRAGKSGKVRDAGIGPGNVTKLLGIHHTQTGLDLVNPEMGGGPSIWIEDRGFRVKHNEIITGPRIGVDYAGQDALLPYRFRIRDNGAGIAWLPER